MTMMETARRTLVRSLVLVALSAGLGTLAGCHDRHYDDDDRRRHYDDHRDDGHRDDQHFGDRHDRY